MKKFAHILALVLLLSSCSTHFISDRSYRQKVEKDYASRQTLLDAAGVSVDDMQLDPKAEEALKFLYAYMSLGDIMNNSPEFYLECYNYTQKAIEEMPWGKDVPERELRHFVLPPRVNNENLDGCRPVFYEELAPRIRDLSMKDAVLEVNHWCHEKVTYKGSDSRTSAPLSTIRTAFGRCGEESTFLVAALRSVGIPARQVYTPRWAHTDDNHAWVEAFVDGEWHFLGACEPEAVLDLGWFNAPASRGMLMATNAFGSYDGPEEKLEVTPLYTRINVVTNYAPDPCKVEVKVENADGTPAAGAKVEYKIYNYAEFYSVATLTADADGLSSITVGNGDMLVQASDGKGNFGFAKASAGKGETVTVKLGYNKDTEIPSTSFSMVPPPEKPTMPEVSEEAREENSRRLKEEDAIRTAYLGTFRTPEQAKAFAEEKGLDPEGTAYAILGSAGNYEEIEKFLAYAAEKGRGDTALRMLRYVSAKDLHDTPAEILQDHLDNCADDADWAVLSPRMYTELLRPWRGALQQAVPAELADMVRTRPAEFVKWCADNLSIYDKINNDYTSVNPVRVWESRVCDETSRELFFIAMCRSFGVPAWKDFVSGSVRYSEGGRDYDVDFEAASQVEAEFGTLKLSYTPVKGIDDPKYYVQFSISSFDGSSFTQLEYGEGDTWAGTFKDGTRLNPGMYVLCSGIRMASGEVCSDLSFFTVRKDETTGAELLLSDDASQLRVIGSFDSESKYVAEPAGETRSILATTGRGYYALALVDGGSEPTVHAFKDIEAATSQLEAWGRPILVVFATKADYERFNAAQYKLPSNVCFGLDEDGSIKKQIAAEMKLADDAALPYVLMTDTFNRVVYFSQGYTIGLGDQILATVSKL